MGILVSGYGGIAWHPEKGSEPSWEEQAAGTSYCAAGDGMLFAAEERADGGAVRLYRPCGNGWELRDCMAISGSELCHLAYSPKQKTLLGACYGSGHVFAVTVDEQCCRFRDAGRSLRQEPVRAAGETRAHSVLLNAAEDAVYSANIAQDCVYCYSFSGGTLSETGQILLPEGVGPRHLLLREDLNKMYVITEYSSEIIVLNLEKTGGSIVQRISALQDKCELKSYCSTLAFSPDGRFLYAANRGENTLAVFEADADGMLSFSSRQSCFGDWPRDFALLDGGALVGIANQKSDEAVFCPRDAVTGRIGEPVWRTHLEGASCIRELP